MIRIAVVGAGVSGLATAEALTHRLSPSEATVTILEKSDRPGGYIRSERNAGFTCEAAANGFLDNAPDTLALIRRLDLESRLVPASDAAHNRFIYRRGRLQAVPRSPMDFVRTRLLSPAVKARLLLEPVIGRPSTSLRANRPADESIHAFAARHIGRQASDVFVDAMVSGIFAGDARDLSLRACFPRMSDLERDHGSLFRALLAKRRTGRAAGDTIAGPSGRLTSFQNGMEELVHALAARLRSRIWLHHEVVAVRSPTFTEGYALQLKDGRTFDADIVVLSGPAAESSSILQRLDREASRLLREIRTAPVAVVCLGYERATVHHPLDGFGFLVPRGENLRLLGAVWDSSIYPARAPAGRVLLRVMMGGARDPEVVCLREDTLAGIARANLAQAMGLRAVPSFVRVFRHRGGIPQYTIGHHDRLQQIEARLAQYPGVFLTGNSYRGPSINACVTDAQAVAARVAELIRQQPPRRAEEEAAAYA
jgi:oxygen-dependent protoporphyrinogen oxidase